MEFGVCFLIVVMRNEPHGLYLIVLSLEEKELLVGSGFELQFKTWLLTLHSPPRRHSRASLVLLSPGGNLYLLLRLILLVDHV
jgi:hypothetical protein